MLKTPSVLLALALLSSGSIANAQKPITKANTIKSSATIQSIDSTQRIVVLRTDKGEEDAFVLGPDVTRFNELKVGDRINFTYVESVVVTVLKPGSATSSSTAAASVVPGKGKLPGATLSQQLTTTVTIKAIDPSVPSVTVTTADGRTVTRKIEDKKNLEGVKVGDRLDITYSQAVMASAERAK